MAGAHFDDTGRARMVDVSGKPETLRIAKARGAIRMEMSTLDQVRDGRLAKGDVMAVAELAGIMAAKRTVDLIPLCHPVGLDAVTVEISEDRSLPGLAVTAEARTTGRTGVEMEAMTAAAIACLTLYDMLKAIDRGMSIVTVELIAKSGGMSGDWVR